MSGEDHYHQPRQGHLSKDQSICYKNEDDYYLSIYRKNEDGDYLEFKDTLDDMMIFTITTTNIAGLILRQNHYHQISQGHPTNDMSDYRALLFVIK